MDNQMLIQLNLLNHLILFRCQNLIMLIQLNLLNHLIIFRCQNLIMLIFLILLIGLNHL
jgi:hypothetical protein